MTLHQFENIIYTTTVEFHLNLKVEVPIQECSNRGSGLEELEAKIDRMKEEIINMKHTPTTYCRPHQSIVNTKMSTQTNKIKHPVNRMLCFGAQNRSETLDDKKLFKIVKDNSSCGTGSKICKSSSDSKISNVRVTPRRTGGYKDDIQCKIVEATKVRPNEMAKDDVFVKPRIPPERRRSTDSVQKTESRYYEETYVLKSPNSFSVVNSNRDKLDVEKGDGDKVRPIIISRSIPGSPAMSEFDVKLLKQANKECFERDRNLGGARKRQIYETVDIIKEHGSTNKRKHPSNSETATLEYSGEDNGSVEDGGKYNTENV